MIFKSIIGIAYTCISVFSISANAALIADRGSLDLLLGGNGITENFESFSVPVGSAIGAAPILDSSTGTGGYVVDGIVVTNITSNRLSDSLQWNGTDYFGQTSQNIVSAGGTLNINFNNSITAFGLDLGVFSGYPDTASITVYGADGITVIASISNISLGSSGGIDTFIGFYGVGPIGAVNISGSQWSPLVDNVSFGNVVIPIPAAVWLFSSGLIGLIGIARRKKA